MRIAIISVVLTAAVCIPLLCNSGFYDGWDDNAWDRERGLRHPHHQYYWYGAPYYYWQFPYHHYRRMHCTYTSFGKLCLYRSRDGKALWNEYPQGLPTY